MTSRIKELVDGVFADPNLAAAITPPRVFEDRDQQATPSQLAEWASFIAANREFVGSVLQNARHTFDLVTTMHKALLDEAEDRLDGKVSGDAGVLINRGFAAQERMAHAKLSQAEGSVLVRASQLQVDRLGAMVRQLDHVHREWRADEFTLDRMIRIAGLRAAISET